MKLKNNKRIILIVACVIVIGGIIGFINFNNSNKIKRILKTESYNYLPKAAKNYVKEVYEETGNIVLTEKNKEDNKAYLNPDYILYLETGKASEYGYVPEPFTVDHSYKNDPIVEKHSSNETENIQNQSYYNLRDSGYITNIYDQGSEGLCWAFASSTSLESHIAIKSKKNKMLTFSEKQVDYATSSSINAIDIGTNPFYNKNLSILGENLNEGGNMIRFNNAAAIGISPVLCQGNCSNNVKYNSDKSITDNMYWKHDYNVNTPLSPYEVFNIDNTQYSVNEMLFFNPLVSDAEDEVNALVQILKNQIVNNGSLYVSVGAYTNFSIEYTPTDGERALNSNGKNLMYYIPKEWYPSSGLNHAVSIIGWDDNYTHNICLNENDFEMRDAEKNGTRYYCSGNQEILRTIKGAWILQNSWGVDKDTYIYLPYISMNSSYSSISEVGNVDFDNSYRTNSQSNQFVKGNTKEKLNKIKIFVSSYNQTINVYYNENKKEIIVNDGSRSTYATLLKTIKTTYPGLYTIDLSDENIIYDNTMKEISFRFDTNDDDYKYYASLHTNNVDETEKYIDITGISKTDENILERCNLKDNKCISEPEEVIFDNDNNVFIIKGITRNLSSNDNLTFTVSDKDGKDVTNLFHVFRNFSVSNNLNALISYNNSEVSLGNYIIKAYYNGKQYDEFGWKLEKHNNIISGLGTEKNPHIIKTPQELNDIRNHTTTNNEVYNMIYGYYALANDLDLTYDTQDEKGLFYNSGEGWNPIYKFAGSFDGNNHVIEGLYIDRPSADSAVGLFGTVFGYDNYIRNSILKNVNINGNFHVGSLIGSIQKSRGFELHDIAIVNGNIVSNTGNRDIGSIIGNMEIVENSEYHFYNLFNNASVGEYTSSVTGGLFGSIERGNVWDSVNNKWIYSEYNFTISDSVNLGNVTGGQNATGGIVAVVSGAKDLTFKNIISVGTYKNKKNDVIGDIFGTLCDNDNTSLNMTNIRHLTRLYGTSFEPDGKHNIENDILVTFRNIVSFSFTNGFNHKDSWINPFIDDIKRIPMLKTMVNHFDFTEKIDDFEIGLTTTMNINNMIKPDIDEAKNIKYTYDEEYLTISSSGVITPKKIGTTTIKIDSLYDGYSDEIQVTIKDTTNIIYNSNNGTNDSVSQLVLLNSSVTLNKNTFEYKGHIFKNWNTASDGTGTSYTDEQLIEEGIDSELQLYAQWTTINYTIYFDGNSGEGEPHSLKLVYPESGNISLGGSTWFTKENYVFDSWNTKIDGSGIKYLALVKDYSIKFDEIPFDENYEIRLYAQWKKVEYSIWLDSNGGLQSQIELKYAFDETKALVLNTFTKTGHTFKNWNTSSDGSGETYTDGQVISTDKHMRLYAQWTPNEQKVSFDSNGGTGTMETQIYYYDVLQEINENLFEKEHYTFKNWNTASDGSGKTYSDKESIKVTSNITLYAQWEANKYTITFNSNDGTGESKTQEVSYNTSTKLNKNTFTKDGFKFTGWNTKEDGTGKDYSDEESVSLSNDLTLYAQWIEGDPYVINKYNYDEKNNYVSNIDVNTTVDTYKQNIELLSGYTVEVDSKTINNKQVLYTGGKTKIYKNKTLYVELTNIVSGDTNGDGKINYLDYVNVYNHIQKLKHPESTKKELKNEYLISADMSKDNKINYVDYVKIYNKIKELKGGN